MKLTDERIREMFDAWFDPDDNGNYWYCFLDAYRMAEAEATKPQEPVGYQELFDAIAAATSVACFPGINISIEGFTAKIGPLFTTPQHCPNCAEGMVSVTKEDANNYCRILTLLGMEEEGSPIEGVEHLISLRDGMTCGDCNDTGWLENREEGRYPCTCMTEAEPYQILQDKCAELEAECAAMRENSKRWHGLFDTAVASLERSENNAVIKEIEADRDALAIQNQQMRDALESIQRYGFDMLSGRVDGPDDRAWQRSGVNEMTKRAQSALALLDTSEIIKRHDAAVLRKAAEHLESYEYVFNAPPINYAEAHELRRMADELEKS